MSTIPKEITQLWGHDGPYNDYSRYIKNRYGQRIQKISLDGGFSCPNRDGTLGYGGCSYCRVSSFVPKYCGQSASLIEQLEKGIDFFASKYGAQAYAGYFQSYSSSHGNPDDLKTMYEGVLCHPGIRTLIIATRPDCIPESVVGLLAHLQEKWAKPVLVELGIESTKNQTLKLINRHHTMEQSREAIQLLHRYNIGVSGHIILGLPGESPDDQLAHVPILNELPLRGLKIHHLQVLKGTPLAKNFPHGDIEPYTLNGYVKFLCRWIPRLRPDMVIERFINEAPQELILAPDWGGVKNYAFVHQLVQALEHLDLYQGAEYKGTYGRA